MYSKMNIIILCASVFAVISDGRYISPALREKPNLIRKWRTTDLKNERKDNLKQTPEESHKMIFGLDNTPLVPQEPAEKCSDPSRPHLSQNNLIKEESFGCKPKDMRKIKRKKKTPEITPDESDLMVLMHGSQRFPTPDDDGEKYEIPGRVSVNAESVESLPYSKLLLKRGLQYNRLKDVKKPRRARHHHSAVLPTEPEDLISARVKAVMAEAKRAYTDNPTDEHNNASAAKGKGHSYRFDFVVVEEDEDGLILVKPNRHSIVEL